MASTVIVRYGELALKSEPVRKRFERSLILSIKRGLVGIDYRIRVERGRIFVDSNSAAAIIRRLSKVPGITSLSQSSLAEANMHDIVKQATRAAKKVLRSGMSFAVRTNRVGDHPFSSRDVNIEAGASIQSRIKNLSVDLSAPDVELFIEIRGENAYIFTKAVKGVGGLPIGTQGKVVSLFSGTRNDAAAAFMMLKRGCKLFPLFLNPNDKVNSSISRRVVSAARKLTGFDPEIMLWEFPLMEVLANLQTESMKQAAFYIFRRCELRAAEIIANRVGAEAIVVSDDAKQLGEQLLSNLKVTDEACKLAVLRPLSGMNDEEVKETAEKTGIKSFSSDLPHPTPSGEIMDLVHIQDLEQKINIHKFVDAASRSTKTFKLR